jgi:chromate transport protein ChrA
MHKTKGGLFAGTLFVLPGLLAIMALSWIYVLLGKVTIVQGLFFGLKAAVLVIVVEAVLRVGKRAFKNNTMRGLPAPPTTSPSRSPVIAWCAMTARCPAMPGASSASAS